MKRIIFILIISLPALLAGLVGITYTLANGNFTLSDSQTYFEFDVMAQATASGTRIGDGIVYLEYSPDAFGNIVYYHNNVTVTRGTLLQTPFPPFQIYGIYLNDSLPTVFAITFEYLQSTGYGTLLPTEPTQLVHVKLLVTNTSSQAWICFWPDEMDGETFYDDHATIYNPIVTGNCIYHDPPLPVELSSFNCSMNNSNTAVNLIWVTQTETNMIGYRILRSDTNNLAEALDQNTLIEATNTAQPQTYLFSDSDIDYDHIYNYWLESIDLSGEIQYYGPIFITTTGLEIVNPDIPLITGLTTLYPNPFNPEITITYTLDSISPVQISVTNIRGQLVRTLVNETKAKGIYSVKWNGEDCTGNPCCSGTYFIKMGAGKQEFNKKVVLLK
jgi:hypothetical protein